MKHKKTKYLIFIIGIFASINSYSQRTYRNDYLNIGAGARNMALGGSTVAGVSDETSTYWNPAGLHALKSKHTVGLMHAEYFAGLSKYDFASYARKVSENSGIAFSLIRMGTDDIPNTLELIDENGNVDYDRISYFSTADYALLVAFAKESNISGLSYGVQAKILYRRLGPFANAFGFGFDAGIQYRKNGWQIGAMLKDATSTFNAWFFDTSELEEVFAQTGNEIPKDTVEFSVPQLNTGIGRKFAIGSDFSIYSELGVAFTFDGKRNSLISGKRISLEPNWGIEAGYKDFIFVRAGVGKFSKLPDFDKEKVVFEPSIGIGLNLFNFRIDYALTNIAGFSGALYSNIFSLSYEF